MLHESCQWTFILTVVIELATTSSSFLFWYNQASPCYNLQLLKPLGIVHKSYLAKLESIEMKRKKCVLNMNICGYMRWENYLRTTIIISRGRKS